MFTRPPDVSDDDVAALVSDRWGFEVEDIGYAAVGFGSHHWAVRSTGGRLFVTVDDLDAQLTEPGDSRSAARERLVAALSTAAALRSSGYEFVVAPITSNAARLVEPIDRRYLLAVYHHREGATSSLGPYASRADRVAVVDLLVRLHQADVAVPAHACDFTIPIRDRLVDAMAETSEPWSTGPLAEPARRLLERHRHQLTAALRVYDQMVTEATQRDPLHVITHGEPHRGNVIFAASGPLLVDWDTTRLAPAERDLWQLVDEDPDIRHHYERASGRLLDDNLLSLFSFGWDLGEIALFVNNFRRPHQATADVMTAWDKLEHHLDPNRWSDFV